MRFSLRRNNERGAALVEAALVMPILALLTFAAIDGGLYFHSYLSVGAAARDGARAIATAGANNGADLEGIMAINKAMSGINVQDVDRVVVFNANGMRNANAPQECLDSDGANSQCNIYLASAGDLSTDSTQWAQISQRGTRRWAGSTRSARRTGAGADRVGVAVKVKAKTPLGVFGSEDQTVVRTVIVQIEARTA